MQVLQRVGLRAQVVQALEEQKAGAHEEQRVRVHLMRRQVLKQVWARAQWRARVYQVCRNAQQQVGARAQAVRTVEEGQGAA